MRITISQARRSCLVVPTKDNPVNASASCHGIYITICSCFGAWPQTDSSGMQVVLAHLNALWFLQDVYQLRALGQYALVHSRMQCGKPLICTRFMHHVENKLPMRSAASVSAMLMTPQTRVCLQWIAWYKTKLPCNSVVVRLQKQCMHCFGVM